MVKCPKCKEFYTAEGYKRIYNKDGGIKMISTTTEGRNVINKYQCLTCGMIWSEMIQK